MSSTPPVAPMWIQLDGAANVRDLGGLPTVEGGAVRPGRLIRSDNLQGLSDADVRRLVDELRVRAVADLRTHIEVESEGPGPLTREPQVEVVHLSLFPDSIDRRDPSTAADAPVVLPWQTRDAAEATGDQAVDVLPEAEARRRHVANVYLRYLDERPDSVLAALRLVAHTDGATIVNCAAGKDRTGTVVAMALAEVGVEPDAIVADYARSGDRIEQIIERLHASPTYAGETAAPGENLDRHRPRAETMRGFLDAITEEYGGVGAWLREHGWRDEDAAALRSALVG